MIVVLPYFSGDAWLLDKNLMWFKELDGHLDYDCVLACDNKTDPKRAQILAKTIFRRVRVLQYDRHQRDAWPFQQNNAWMNVAWEMAKQKEPWFWTETDAVPLKRGWLDIIRKEYEAGKKSFGGHWNPATNVFNGVAVYPPNISHYSQRMMTAALVDAKDPQGRPYQPPWDFYGSEEVRPHLHVMNHVMQHLWEINGQCPTFPNGDRVAELVRPEVCLFHRCKDGTLIDRLRDPGRIGSKARCLVGLDTVHLKTIQEPAQSPAVASGAVPVVPVPPSIVRTEPLPDQSVDPSHHVTKTGKLLDGLFGRRRRGSASNTRPA